MRRNIISIAALIALDQGVKLLILFIFIDQTIVLIPGVLALKPVINTNLSWIASMADYQTPVALMVFLQLAFLALAVLMRRYCIYLLSSARNLADISFSFLTAGVGCSFIDVVFWGGSLDFLRLFNWFTFDGKDVFLTLCIFFLILFLIRYEKFGHSLSKEERRSRSFGQWLTKGCPIIRASKP